MGLIRNAAIVAVAITLIPADPQDRAQLYAKAHDGVAWISTFCDRNEATCVKGQQFGDAFVEKAGFAAAAAYDIALTHMTETDQPNELGQSQFRPLRHFQSNETLTVYDRKVAWRGHR